MLGIAMIDKSAFKRESRTTESTSEWPSDPHLGFVLLVVMFGEFEQNAGFEATDIATKEIGQSWASIFDVLDQKGFVDTLEITSITAINCCIFFPYLKIRMKKKLRNMKKSVRNMIEHCDFTRKVSVIAKCYMTSRNPNVSKRTKINREKQRTEM